MCVRNGGGGESDDHRSSSSSDNNHNNNHHPRREAILATSVIGGDGSAEPQRVDVEVLDDEWEEWDGKSPFLHHCIAGSLAGVAEHTLVYPLDTVRTHIQVCAACHYNGQNPLSSITKAAMPASSSGRTMSVLQQAAASAASASSTGTPRAVHHGIGPATTTSASGATAVHNMSMMQALRQLVGTPTQPLSLSAATATATVDGRLVTSESATNAVTAAAVSNNGGISRLWRGVQTILVGCIPAHALYFSTYEIIKAATLDDKGNVTTYGSALAGAAAVVSHDLVLGPLDTVKQRLQLGHYNGLSHALRLMIQNEGVVSLFRSFPVTLATNIPYGMVMVGTNECLKQQWTDDGNEKLTLPVMLGASSVAGFVAAATTTPLDRIKTYLQTQQLSPACLLSPVSGQAPDVCPLTGQKGGAHPTSVTTAPSPAPHKPLVADFRQAAMRIYQTEGAVGFFRGLTPRVLSHTPAVAISWTTYETAKKYLSEHFGN